MTKTSWGLKRQCPRCANRYYDLGKNPATCPKCKFLHDINAPVKVRRSRGKSLGPAHAADPVALKPDSKKLHKAIEADGEELDDIEIEEVEEIEEVDDIEVIEDIEDGDDDAAGDINKDILEEDSVADAVLVDDINDGMSDDMVTGAKSAKSDKKSSPLPKAKPSGKILPMKLSKPAKPVKVAKPQKPVKAVKVVPKKVVKPSKPAKAKSKPTVKPKGKAKASGKKRR